MDLVHAETQPGLASAPEIFGQEFPGFSALYDYWQSIRNGKAIPRSADFDLLAVTNWLPDMSLLDVQGVDSVHWRFAGTAIVERMGYDPSGQNALSAQSKNLLDRVARAYQNAVTLPCGVLSYYTNHYASGREGNVHTLYLPLEAPSGETTRLVSLTIRDENATFAEPIERTVTATKIHSIKWIDLGFGVPPLEN